MGKVVEAKTKQKSDRLVAEELLAAYGEMVKEKSQASNGIKEVELQLLEMAEKHPEWFDGKTASFENGKLVWKAQSKVETPEDFDLKAFQKKYPALVEVKVSESIPIGKLRAFLDDPKIAEQIGSFGVGIATEDRFSVVV